MKKLYILIISILISSITNANETAVVDTDVLLVKKYAKNDSKKLSFYKMNDLITIIGEQKDSEEILWYKTNKGFIKAQYVIKENDLPKFLNINNVNTNKNAIQLIVFNLNAKKALIRLQKILKNEKNIFVERTSKAQVVYLVNFDSYKKAKQKQKEISKYYKTSFITKIKNLKPNDTIVSKKIVKKVIKQNKIKKVIVKKKNNTKKDYNEFKDMDINIEDEIGSIDIDKQMAEFDDDNIDEQSIEYKTNDKPIYSVNKVKTLNFAKNTKEKNIKNELETIKVTKIIQKPKKEIIQKTKIEKIKVVKKEIVKKDNKIENSFYTNNNVQEKEYKTTSRFKLRVFNHSKKDNNKEKTFKNNYFKDEVKSEKAKPIVIEKLKPKIKKEVKKEIKKEIIIKKVIPVKKIEAIKLNLTDKIENLLLGL